MGWLITLCVITILAIVPLGVGIRYDSNGLLVQLVISFIRIQLFPKTKTEKKKNSKRKISAKDRSDKKESSGGNLSDFMPLVKTALDFLNQFSQKICVERLHFKLILCGDDPADLAVNYGKGWVVLGNLMPLLEQVFVIKKRDLEVECDFCAPATTVLASADILIPLYKLLALVVCYGIRVLKQYSYIMNNRKGGAHK